MMHINSVLVTYNRLNDLKKTLNCYMKQTFPPETLIVVDNASNDGTKEYLDKWAENTTAPFKTVIIHNDVNEGGAGGFSRGIQEALKTECDFVFLADDDAFPEPDMFEKLNLFYEGLDHKERVAALCTAVIDQYGWSNVQRGHLKKGLFFIKREDTKDSEYERESFDIDLLTFVGACIKKKTIEEIGLPLKEYFIHEDDAEYSMRIREKGRILLVTSSKIHHKRAGKDEKLWLSYYTTRNHIDCIRRHYGGVYYYSAIADKWIRQCSVAAKLFRGRSREYRKMNQVAIHDAEKGNLGINSVYRPGVEIK